MAKKKRSPPFHCGMPKTACRRSRDRHTIKGKPQTIRETARRSKRADRGPPPNRYVLGGGRLIAATAHAGRRSDSHAPRPSVRPGRNSPSSAPRTPFSK